MVELLRELPDSLAERLVAAYVIGYRVTEEDLAASAAIRPATGADGAGVTVCYNSVADESAICPVLSPSRLCINPLNWHTDGEPAPLNDTVTVRVDPRHGVLLVEGFDPRRITCRRWGRSFPSGTIICRNCSSTAMRSPRTSPSARRRGTIAAGSEPGGRRILPETLRSGGRVNLFLIFFGLSPKRYIFARSFP